MFCTRCGIGMARVGNFCPRCGTMVPKIRRAAIVSLSSRAGVRRGFRLAPPRKRRRYRRVRKYAAGVTLVLVVLVVAGQFMLADGLVSQVPGRSFARDLVFQAAAPTVSSASPPTIGQTTSEAVIPTETMTSTPRVAVSSPPTDSTIDAFLADPSATLQPTAESTPKLDKGRPGCNDQTFARVLPEGDDDGLVFVAVRVQTFSTEREAESALQSELAELVSHGGVDHSDDAAAGRLGASIASGASPIDGEALLYGLGMYRVDRTLYSVAAIEGASTGLPSGISDDIAELLGKVQARQQSGRDGLPLSDDDLGGEWTPDSMVILSCESP